MYDASFNGEKMSFLSPIWLLAVAAVTIPIVIHLWHTSQKKVLKVGSISLLALSSRKERRRSFKLSDLPLLILRCLLLIMVAMLLAGLLWQAKQDALVKGWLLIPKENFKEGYTRFKPLADSLTRGGYEFHYFNSGFERSTILKATADTGARNPSLINNNYWELAEQLNTKMPSAIPVCIITPALLSRFEGVRAVTGKHLLWKTYQPKDSVFNWIENAWLTSSKAIRIVRGISKPSGTTYSAETVIRGDQQKSPYTITATNGQLFIGLKDNRYPAVAVDTGILKASIYADKKSDASYVKAALQTVSQFTQKAISIDPLKSNSANGDWLFWLSEKPVNKNIARRFKNILSYEPGKIVNEASWISNDDGFTVSQSGRQIALYQLITSNNSGERIWHDGFNNPVLSVEQRDSTTRYHFYSRFDPAWNDLVWNAAFPQMILKLVVNPKKNTQQKMFDRRIIDQQQLQPLTVPSNYQFADQRPGNNSITHYFWIVLAVLFLAERLLSYHNTENGKNSAINE